MLKIWKPLNRKITVSEVYTTASWTRLCMFPIGYYCQHDLADNIGSIFQSDTQSPFVFNTFLYQTFVDMACKFLKKILHDVIQSLWLWAYLLSKLVDLHLSYTQEVLVLNTERMEYKYARTVCINLNMHVVNHFMLAAD